MLAVPASGVDMPVGKRGDVVPDLVLVELMPGTTYLMIFPCSATVFCGGHHMATNLYLYLVHYCNFGSSRKLIWWFPFFF